MVWNLKGWGQDDTWITSLTFASLLCYFLLNTLPYLCASRITGPLYRMKPSGTVPWRTGTHTHQPLSTTCRLCMPSLTWLSLQRQQKQTNKNGVGPRLYIHEIRGRWGPTRKTRPNTNCEANDHGLAHAGPWAATSWAPTNVPGVGPTGTEFRTQKVRDGLSIWRVGGSPSLSGFPSRGMSLGWD